MEPTELPPSELGTQEYWQETYSKEIRNFEDHGDPGDVWFGEDAAFRVIEWISKNNSDRTAPIIDLGCGNGYTLIELAREGFTNLLGIDYCQEAITLAQKVTHKQFPFIKFKTFDITKDSTSDLGTKFRIVHDKGTYDAVSLNPENAKQSRMKYMERVAKMLDEKGLFVITSCNWTEEELVSHFEEKLAFHTVIPTPQFKFGGKTGSMVSSVVFKNKGE